MPDTHTDNKLGQNMASEPSWGPCMGQGPLKWTEIGRTNDPWMISDEFETFGDKKIFIFEIQNIH